MPSPPHPLHAFPPAPPNLGSFAPTQWCWGLRGSWLWHGPTAGHCRGVETWPAPDPAEGGLWTCAQAGNTAASQQAGASGGGGSGQDFTGLTLGSHSTPWNVGGLGTGKMGEGHKGEAADLKMVRVVALQLLPTPLQSCPFSFQGQGTRLGAFSLPQSHGTWPFHYRRGARHPGHWPQVAGSHREQQRPSHRHSRGDDGFTACGAWMSQGRHRTQRSQHLGEGRQGR